MGQTIKPVSCKEFEILRDVGLSKGKIHEREIDKRENLSYLGRDIAKRVFLKYKSWKEEREPIRQCTLFRPSV